MVTVMEDSQVTQDALPHLPNQAPKYTSLRGFIATAIAGGHTADEVNAILDQIEQGVGLLEHERQYAEAVEGMPACDEEDPAYQRGVTEATMQYALQITPLLESLEGAGHSNMPICPKCRAGGGLHLDGCELDRALTALRPVYRAAQKDLYDRNQAQLALGKSPVAKALDGEGN